MTRESCVKHPARNATVVLRADYLKLCDGDCCAAMILSQHEHWHNVALDNRQQAKDLNQAAVRASEEPTQDVEMWRYMPQSRMKGQLMGLFGDKAVTAGYKKILDKGFIKKRTNPRYTWDKALQYLFVVDVVQAAIDALTPLGEETEDLKETEDADGDDSKNNESADLQGSRAQKCGLDTAEVRHGERKDADSRAQKCATLKTTSPKTKTKTSSSETARDKGGVVAEERGDDDFLHAAKGTESGQGDGTRREPESALDLAAQAVEDKLVVSRKGIARKIQALRDAGDSDDQIAFALTETRERVEGKIALGTIQGTPGGYWFGSVENVAAEIRANLVKPQARQAAAPPGQPGKPGQPGNKGTTHYVTLDTPWHATTDGKAEIAAYLDALDVDRMLGLWAEAEKGTAPDFKKKVKCVESQFMLIAANRVRPN